ncbi:neurotensin receptor type 1 [Erinaceus europaeus]|uniref:Neurotensin receptor type 1 n=1 Tax=Erinaceus europaeus TaxID=9365 RepID=A0A1S2ZJT3_ERIEU|nr:neurotensin receptor type 1 [Erinaceus europaeus]
MRLNSSTPGSPGRQTADSFLLPSGLDLALLDATLLAAGLVNRTGNVSESLVATPRGELDLNTQHVRATSSSHLDVNTDIYSKVLVTAVYLVLFVVGTVGNAVTAFTLARKKSLQNLQSTVHYHLGSLAASDLLILLLAMPVELYNFIWVHHPWAFGDAVCRGYYFLRDACTYATALNVASLSVERYLAICHPFKAKTLMSRSRTKKFISAIWLASGLLAVPMLFTMGQQNQSDDGQHPGGLVCTPIVGTATIKIVIQINTFMSFVFPMVVISVLNTIIANKLTVMVRQAAEQGQVCTVGDQHNSFNMSIEPSRVQALRHGVHVLRAVVVAFVVCLLPYHVRRLMFCYISENHWTTFLYDFYHYFYMLTNVLFYVSSTVNPILYNLVSANFRQIFLSTLVCLCPLWGRRRRKPTFSRKTNSVSSNHTFSSNVTRETLY